MLLSEMWSVSFVILRLVNLRVNMAARALLLPLLALALAAPIVRAYPYYFIDDIARGNCQALPDREYGSHGPPRADPAIVITVQGSSGVLCPGAVYTVSLGFPVDRRFILVASTGAFQTPFDSACPNRAATGRTGASFRPVTSHTNRLTIPCSASGRVTLRVVSAASSGDTYNTAEAGFTIDQSCAASTCPGAVVHSPPEPAPSTVVASPSPVMSAPSPNTSLPIPSSPSPVPAYPGSPSVLPPAYPGFNHTNSTNTTNSTYGMNTTTTASPASRRARRAFFF